MAPDRGEIRYRGQDITGLSPDRRARLGMCRSFQILNLFNDYTALQNVRVAVPAMRQRGLISGRLPVPCARRRTRPPASSA